MKNNIKINVIEVNQKNNVFYIGKMKTSDLIKIATVYFRDDESHYTDKKYKYLEEVKSKLKDTIEYSESSSKGIQRILQTKRLNEISEYLKTEDGLLPNSIIVALNNKVKIEADEEVSEEGFGIEETACQGIYNLLIDTEKVNAFIVDGQHRLGSFAFAKELIDEYELPVTIFLDMQVPLQAEIFGKINGTQKPVNKSLLYDLKEFDDKEYSDITKCHVIAKWFNINSRSPFYKKIKMLGTGYGTLSQSAFIDEIVKYIKQRPRGKGYKSIFYGKDEKYIITVLYNYFCAIRNIYGEEVWNNDKKYVLTRTTGYGSLIKLLYYVYIKFLLEDKELSLTNFQAFLTPISKVTDFSIESVGKSAGQGLQTYWRDQFLQKLFGSIDLKQLEADYSSVSKID